MANKTHGKYAFVTFGGETIPFTTQWTCTLNQTVSDSSSMSATNHGRTRKVGFKSGTATVTAWMTEGAWVDGAAGEITDGQTDTLILGRGAVASTGGYTGEAQVTSRAATDPKDGVVAVTYNFAYNGAITALS